ncbi:MAG: hypothetical protein CMJ45_04105 [Planctomyces sp.]|nr:hypothetical protein [Planctomyces sp.]
MPTKPLESVLYRELSKAEAKSVIEVASPLLREIVNYGTNAFMRCATSTPGEVNEDVALLTLYLHIIEMTDGIEILVSESCPAPAIPLVRSSWEALISMEYILEADYLRRSLAWLANYARTRLDGYRSLDSSTIQGKEFLEALAADRWVRVDVLAPSNTDMEELLKGIANLEKFLARPQFQTVEEEYVRTKKKRKSRPQWFQLFDGPTSIRGLARHLNRHAQYDFLYRSWSSVVHAQDASRLINRRLRDANSNKQITSFATSLFLSATQMLLKKFRPGEDLSVWYKDEVRERFLLIGKP